MVLIADKLAQSTVEALGDAVEVRWVDGPNREELLAAVPEADAILVRSATTVDAEVLAAAPQRKSQKSRCPISMPMILKPQKRLLPVPLAAWV